MKLVSNKADMQNVTCGTSGTSEHPMAGSVLLLTWCLSWERKERLRVASGNGRAPLGPAEGGGSVPGAAVSSWRRQGLWGSLRLFPAVLTSVF